MMLHLKTLIENISLLLIIINDILNVKEKELVNKSVIDKKLINVNKKITLNETKHIEADKKLTDLTKKLQKYQKKNMIFC